MTQNDHHGFDLAVLTPLLISIFLYWWDQLPCIFCNFPIIHRFFECEDTDGSQDNEKS